jgi:hypothetical protein
LSFFGTKCTNLLCFDLGHFVGQSYFYHLTHLLYSAVMKPYTLLMSQIPLRPEDYPPGFAAYVQPLLGARQRILQRLSDEERYLCHQILEMFFRCGRGPTIDELVSVAAFSMEKVTSYIERLNSVDFLKYDASTRQVVVLYPFSALSGTDCVQIQGKPLLHGM